MTRIIQFTITILILIIVLVLIASFDSKIKESSEDRWAEVDLDLGHEAYKLQIHED